MQQYSEFFRPSFVSGFAKHIREAIAVNRERRSIYAEITGGESRRLSSVLIVLERMVLPVAWYFDLKGRKWNIRGVGIVRDDFMPMLLREPIEPITKTVECSPQILRLAKYHRAKFLRAFSKNLALEEKLEASKVFLSWIREFEKSNSIHLAMTKHILESMVYIAKNGLKYSTETDGRTVSLTSALLWWHCLALRNALKIDQMANEFHMDGVGILVNDLPEVGGGR